MQQMWVHNSGPKVNKTILKIIVSNFPIVYRCKTFSLFRFARHIDGDGRSDDTVC